MLLCFGSPLVDISASVDNQFLEKYQLIPDSTVLSQSFHKPIFQQILSYKHKIIVGGSVTNTARVCQWILRKPNNVFYVGTIGRDKFGDMVKQKLEEEQISLYLLENEKEETGKVAVLVTGNEKQRTLVTNLGASKIFEIENLKSPSLQNIIKTCIILYISTFFLGVSTEVVKEVITTFKNQGKHKKVVINLGATYLCETYPAEVKLMFNNADIVIGNEKEFISFAKISGTFLPKEDLEKNIINLACTYFDTRKTSYLLIITRGCDSVVTCDDGKIQHHEVEQVENIVDTNGAGDAFIGGFLAKFMENSTLEECIKCGQWCANHILQRNGCDFDNKLVYE